MLVSLSKVESETQKAVIRRLFQLGDVNVKAKQVRLIIIITKLSLNLIYILLMNPIQNGQTALMLAASHGQFITCKVLMECGADVNLQDNDGSTALVS